MQKKGTARRTGEKLLYDGASVQVQKDGNPHFADCGNLQLALMPQAADCSFCCSTVHSSMTRLCPGNRRFFLFTACANAARAVTFCCSTKSNQKRNQGRTGTTHFAQVPVPLGTPITTPHLLLWQVLTPSVRPAGGQLPEGAHELALWKPCAYFSALRLADLFPPSGNSPVRGNVAKRQRGLLPLPRGVSSAARREGVPSAAENVVL